MDGHDTSDAFDQIWRADGIGAAARLRSCTDRRYRDALRRIIACGADVVFDPTVLIRTSDKFRILLSKTLLSISAATNSTHGPVFTGPFCRVGRILF